MKEFKISAVIAVILVLLMGPEKATAFVMAGAAAVFAWAVYLILRKGFEEDFDTKSFGLIVVLAVISIGTYAGAIAYGGLLGIITGPVVFVVLTGAYLLGEKLSREDEY